MSYRVLLYCPDRHVEYDANTPEYHGIGGGVTSRIRMAKGLASRGHEIIMVGNFPKHEVKNGVSYIPLSEFRSWSGDIVVGNTSGGEFDISEIESLDINATIRILWVSGVARPSGIEVFRPDYFYAKSNFLYEELIDKWIVDPKKIFVAYNAYDESYYQNLAVPSSYESFKVAYASHPEKGLVAAIGVVEELKKLDARFSLDVYGSEKLWGEIEKERSYPPWVNCFGTVGQKELAHYLARSSILISLQDIQEGFGLTVLEAMRAGCCVIASRVGAYPELIDDGRTGLLIDSEFDSRETWKTVARIINELITSKEKYLQIRSAATTVPWNIDLMSIVWEQHWNQIFGLSSTSDRRRYAGRCLYCDGMAVSFADGKRCQTCSRYFHEFM